MLDNPYLVKLQADLLLLHPPAYFEFRARRDIYFPFLETSGAVPISPLYEYFPIGFKSLQRYLAIKGYDVKIVNLAVLLQQFPQINLDTLFNSLDVSLVGIDLHWMVHVQGSLAIAERLKLVRRDIPILFGGISSTYYANEIIRYPYIDFVMRGYDTHRPMAQLMAAIDSGHSLGNVDNLLWKSPEKKIVDNGFYHKPHRSSYCVDWSDLPKKEKSDVIPILEMVSTSNSGCSYNCGWCGGSRDAFKRVHATHSSLAYVPFENIRYEFESMGSSQDIDRYHFYPVNFYNEPASRIDKYLDLVERAGLKSISYEQYYLTPVEVLKKMVAANKHTTITLSPESHDIRVSKLAGRGVYTNQELERWIEIALGLGIYRIDLWYFVGMPEQDETSVMHTVEYTHHIMSKFRNLRLNPMICPMIPFLDPASTFFENPSKHGYRVFYRTVDEHRQAMGRASIINRLNYETAWLSRADIVKVGYKAIKRLMQVKADTGFLPGSVVKMYNARIDDALEFIQVVHKVDEISDSQVRLTELEKLGDEIQARNELVFSSCVSNQAVPISRRIGKRWFDELGWELEHLENLQTYSAANYTNKKEVERE